jgi:hypothetical protein
LVAIGLVALLGSAACGASPGEPPDPPATGEPPAVEFTAKVSVEAQALRITYRLENRSGQALVVLNDVPAYNGDNQIPDVNAVYITGRPDSNRVEIAKRAFAMPQGGVTWTHPTQVSGVIVANGDSAHEELVVPLPLQRHHPYGDDIGEGTIKLPDPISEVVFCVGVVPAAQAPAPSGPKVTLPHLSSTTAVQHLFCSPPTKL